MAMHNSQHEQQRTLSASSLAHWHICELANLICGQRRIRTSVLVREQIYSLSPLATRPSAHRISDLQIRCTEPLVGIEPTTYWLQISCSTSWAKVALLFKHLTLASNQRSPDSNRDAQPIELKWHSFLQPATASQVFQGCYGGRGNKELPPFIRGGKGKGIW